MFHIGHLNLLRKAKEYCEFLLVGVSTDEVTISYKKKKPIIPFEERLAIVAELRCVDQAVAQETMDKLVVWERYRYDVLFHGSDWKDTDMYREIQRRLELCSVDVVFLPYTSGTSSTILSEKLYNLNGVR